ncbi:hypothetical protein SUGI_1031160 [Cryptomeria japonica]|nr:hypothetical protein SUGI_1031160 [Cryptomeria japonica]
MRPIVPYRVPPLWCGSELFRLQTLDGKLAYKAVRRKASVVERIKETDLRARKDRVSCRWLILSADYKIKGEILVQISPRFVVLGFVWKILDLFFVNV